MQNTPIWKAGQSLKSFIAENYIQFHSRKKALPLTPAHIRQQNGRKPNATSVRMKPQYKTNLQEA